MTRFDAILTLCKLTEIDFRTCFVNVGHSPFTPFLQPLVRFADEKKANFMFILLENLNVPF